MKKIGIILGIILGIIISTKNVTAARIAGGNYGYKINNGKGSTSTWEPPMPAELLTGSLGDTKTLYGYNVSGYIDDEFSGNYAYNSIRIQTRLQCSTALSGSGCGLYVADSTEINGRTNTGRSISGTCSLDDKTNNYMVYSCTLSASGYEYPTEFSLTIGHTINFTGSPIAVSCGGVGCSSYGNIASIQIQWVNFFAESTQDPNTALLQEQINQNNTIIDQNNTTNNLLEQQNQQDQEDRENIENQTEKTEQQGQDASDEASKQGQTLLEAFGSLINAIGNIHSTDCTIPNFSIYGLNFENMDFCQFNVPDGLMALASIGMIFIFVPLGINLVKRMIALYNEILGGK